MVDGLKGLGVLETDEDPTASCHAPFQQGDSPLPAHTQTHTPYSHHKLHTHRVPDTQGADLSQQLRHYTEYPHSVESHSASLSHEVYTHHTHTKYIQKEYVHYISHIHLLLMYYTHQTMYTPYASGTYAYL